MYDPDLHGEPLIEWVADPDPTVHAMTAQGWVIRRAPDGPFRTYYTFNPTALPILVASVRAASWQRITRDDYTGPTPDPGGARRRGTVAKTAEKKAKTTRKVEEKPLRMGAKASALISKQGMEKGDREALVKKATAVARKHDLPGGRPETILRDYHVYIALGQEMPEAVGRAWKHLQETGKEMSRATPGKASAAGGTVPAPAAEGETAPGESVDL